jgi:hypothetical protein
MIAHQEGCHCPSIAAFNYPGGQTILNGLFTRIIVDFRQNTNTIGIYTLRYYITERIVPPSTRMVAPLT